MNPPDGPARQPADAQSRPAAEPWRELKRLFAAVSELPAGERLAFLEAECGDPELRAEVDDLLAHADNTAAHDAVTGGESFLQSPIGQHGAPERIDEYRVGRRLGAGGMGTVYEARQESPHRTVALKVLHSLAMPDSTAQRFRAEAEILARLQHPGIAQVYAAGTHVEAGSTLPWFAMELVPGALPLTSWCQRERRTQQERLELFRTICDAVQHGHDKGVVHRDLKPGNVLVSESGQPKFIDYGVAHVAAADDAVMKTTAGELIGTLAYMSPEQCRGEPGAVDARTDTYALGVMLYELMTGRLPYATAGLPIPAALRVVIDAAPRRAPELPADLEAITLKALEKEPQRRYPSAAALAADIDRFLRSEPVTARPPSLSYHLRLFARRHRTLFVAASVIAIVLAGAAAVSSMFAVEASHRADEATGERDAANETLAILEHALRAANPFVEQRDVTVSEIMDGVATRLESGEVVRADVRMRLHRQVGATYRGLGRSADAEHQLEQALAILPQLAGDRRRDRADLELLLGAAHGDRGDAAGAIDHVEKAIAILTAIGAIESGEGVAAWARHGSYLLQQKQFDAAEQSLVRAVELGARIPTKKLALAEANAALGTLSWQRGESDAAGKYWRSAIAVFDRQLTSAHPLAARTRNNYGLWLQAEKRFDEAEAMFRGARDQLAELRGARSPDVSNAELKLGFFYVELGKHEAAERAFETGIAIRRENFGDDAVQVAQALQGLAYLRLQQERWSAAIAPLQDALKILAAKLPAGHPEIAGSQVLLGRALTGNGDAATAEGHLRAALASRKKIYGATNARVATTESALGHCLLRLDRLEDAAPLLRQSLPRIRSALGDDHPETRAAVARVAELDAAATKR
ncbi:MAG: serine/threonine-protein kinase [bacterium]|nr:serine/threonine-protein kinase [bacterium]